MDTNRVHHESEAHDDVEAHYSGLGRLELLAEIRGPESARAKRARRTEAELAEAVREDEQRTGLTMTPREREAFARGFYGHEYAEEVRALAAAGLLDSEDAGEE